jgi:hypothetical protein
MADLLTNLAAAAGAAGDAEIEPLGVDYDGSADYLSRATDLTGNSDGKTFTFSAWLYPTVQPSSGFFFDIADPVGGVPNPKRFYMRISSNQLLIQVATTPYETIVLTATSSASLPNDTFCNILVSCDMANAANRYIYINDVADSVTWTTYANLNIPFTGGAGGVGFGIGATASGDANYKGRISGLYLDYTYRDLSIEANRRLFIDDDGLYVTPPTTGIISVPMDDPADPGRNDGTGGNFTLNGVVARSGRGPNEYNAAASTLDGSADFLSRTSIIGIADGKVVTFSAWFKLDSNSSSGENTIIFFDQSFDASFQVKLGNSAKQLDIVGRDSGGNAVLNFFYELNGGNTITLKKWFHLAFSVDLTSTGTRNVLLNGVNITSSGTFSSYTNTNMALLTGETDYYISEQPQSANREWNGEFSDIYFDTTYIDLSADNPFYDTDTDKPKFLGATGNLPTGSAPLIYLPLYASSAGTNLGTGGDFTVNSGPYVGARGPSEFWADSAAFNGTTQYLSRTSIAGAVSSKTFTLVLAFYQNAYQNAARLLCMDDSGAAGDEFHAHCLDVDLSFRLTTRSSSPAANNLAVNTSASSAPRDAWHIVLVSVDLSDTNKRHLYLNGVSNATWTTYVDEPVSFNTMDVINIGRDFDNSNYWPGNIGFLWFNTNYIDFSQEANRLKFFDAFNNPVDLGADGSVPTGSQPLIYMNEGFHLGTNLGSGGNFTPQNTPTDGGYVNG